MLDPTFCNKKFPMPWKTSIAISGYEPDESLFPSPFCGGKLTYLKVTVTIAGYQPTDDEIKKGYTEFGKTPVEVGLDEIFATYFGCYGVLLNVAVFPNSEKKWGMEDYPRIISMEPQVRELAQSSTETGEVLTSSKQGASTTNSYSDTHSTKTGITAKADVGGEKPIKWNAGIEATKSWEHTTADSVNTNIDGSQERRETQSTSTELQQLYNLLSAYHLGTNRGVFLMLPRPHVLQPTIRRSFVQGVRSIEGIQEFFLIVSRPKDMEGICVEAKLDTAHFPEDVQIKEPPVNYKESYIDFVVARHADNNKKITQLDTTFNVPSGWYVDRRTTGANHPKGDSGHVGISATDIGSNAQGSPINYDYQAVSDTQVVVSGHIQGGGIFGAGAIFNKKYRVYLRSIDPIPSEVGESVEISDLFVTSRDLCCCFKSGNPCLIKGAIPPRPIPPLPDYATSKIVEQRNLKVEASLLSDAIAKNTLDPAIKGLIRQLKSIMVSTRNDRYSHFEDGISYLDSDFFVKSVLKFYPESVKNLLLSDIREIDKNVLVAYGAKGTVNDALSDSLSEFIIKTGLNYDGAVNQRRLIGLQIRR